MADQKVSALSLASDPTGTELVPIVQGGVSKRATVAQIRKVQISDVVNLTSTIAGKAASLHSHAVADITDWATAFRTALTANLVQGANVSLSTDGSGRTIIAAAGGGVGGGNVNSVNDVTPDVTGDVNLTQSQVPEDATVKHFTAALKTKLDGLSQYTDAMVRTLLGIDVGATVATLEGDNVWTGAQQFAPGSLDVNAIGNLNSALDNYMATKGYFRTKTHAFGTTPSFEQGVEWHELASGVSVAPSPTLVSHNASAVDGQSYTFTLDSTMPAASAYLAVVCGGAVTAGQSAPIPSSVAGRGLIWNKVGAGINQSSGTNNIVGFEATGSPDPSGNITVTFPASPAVGGCHLMLVALSNVNPTIPANGTKYATASTALTAPVVTLDADPNVAHFQILAIVVNSSTPGFTSDPGTPLGTTVDIATSGPSMSSRISYRAAGQAQRTNTWAKTTSAQYAAAAFTFAPAA